MCLPSAGNEEAREGHEQAVRLHRQQHGTPRRGFTRKKVEEAFRLTRGVRDPTIPRSRWRWLRRAGLSIRGRGLFVHWPKKRTGMPSRRGQLSERLGPWQPRQARCRCVHRNGRGDGQAGDIESDALASQNKYHSFKALSPTGHGERELPFQVILGELRGYGCSLLALVPGLVVPISPLRQEIGTAAPGQGARGDQGRKRHGR